jgi:hypothetical protein
MVILWGRVGGGEKDRDRVDEKGAERVFERENNGL